MDQERIQQDNTTQRRQVETEVLNQPVEREQKISSMQSENADDEDLQLYKYGDTPLFDQERAAMESGVPPMTLRAWERRYGLPSPRYAGNSAFYSWRDIAVASWLRSKIAAGMGVRQAMAAFARIEPTYAFSKQGLNPLIATPPRNHPLPELQEPLLRAISQMDEAGAGAILADAFATHPIGPVCQQLLEPLLLHLAELRKRGTLPFSAEALAGNVARAQAVHLIEAGITPKEAVRYLSLLTTQATKSAAPEQTPQEIAPAVAPVTLSSLEPTLLDAVYRMDDAATQQILDEAFHHYSVEEVCINLLQVILYHVGMLWEKNNLSIIVERFATNIIRTRLSYLLQTTPNTQTGPVIFVGCAPQEPHEIGALMLALFWRRVGLNIIYLGQMVEGKSLIQEIRTRRPSIVCLSAMTRPRIKELVNVSREIAKLDPPKPIFCFGGGAFGRDPKLIRSVKGIYLGTNAETATQRLQELVRLQSTFSLQELGDMIP